RCSSTTCACTTARRSAALWIGSAARAVTVGRGGGGDRRRTVVTRERGTLVAPVEKFAVELSVFAEHEDLRRASATRELLRVNHRVGPIAHQLREPPTLAGEHGPGAAGRADVEGFFLHNGEELHSSCAACGARALTRPCALFAKTACHLRRREQGGEGMEAMR